MEAGQEEMSAFIDATIGFGIVIIFFYLILYQMMKRNPKLREGIGEYFPYLKSREPQLPFPTKEESQQVWQEKRTII